MKDRFWGTTVGVLLTIGLFFSGLFSWLTPLPLFYIARRDSFKRGAIGWVIVILLVWGFYEFLFSFLGKDASGVDFRELFGKKALLGGAMIYLCFFGSQSLILAWRSGRDTQVIRLLAWVMGGALAVCLIVLLLFTKGHLISFAKEFSRSMGLILDRAITLRQSSGLSGEEIAFLEKNRQVITTSFFDMVRMIPGFIFAFGLFLTWINVAVAKQVFAPFGFFGQLEDLSSFRIPFFGVWAVIGALSLFLANTYLWQREYLNFALFNFFIVLLALYFFQGLAIASFYLTLKGVTPWMRLLFYSLLLIFFESLGLFLVGVGFFDSWFDFRKINAYPSA